MTDDELEQIRVTLRQLADGGNGIASYWIRSIDRTATVNDQKAEAERYLQWVGRMMSACGQVVEAFRSFAAGVVRALAALQPLVTPDAFPLDAAPDRCWRCDSSSAASEIGLCMKCHVELAETPMTKELRETT